MTTRFHNVLQQWFPIRDEFRWVLGTIIETRRSSYRKAGAMMLMGDLGQRLGLLSGGCLESDLMRQSQKTLATGKSRTVHYDLSEDGDQAWAQGLGCGGYIKIFLQEASTDNQYLGLTRLLEALEANASALFEINTSQSSEVRVTTTTDNVAQLTEKPVAFQRDNDSWISIPVLPMPHLTLFGGGVDAQPVAQIAKTMGWQVTVVDPRSGYGKATDFPGCTCQENASPAPLTTGQTTDAIVIMNHNITLDADALTWAQKSQAKFIGMLGPEHRRMRVEKAAHLTPNDFTQYYCGPVGIDIGAQLPETIALSIMAEVHRVIEGSPGRGQSTSQAHVHD